jgi:hypothetical protein
VEVVVALEHLVQPEKQAEMVVLDCNLASPGPHYIMQAVAAVAHTLQLLASVGLVEAATELMTILLQGTELLIPGAVAAAQDIQVSLAVAADRVW